MAFFPPPDRQREQTMHPARPGPRSPALAAGPRARAPTRAARP